MLSKVMIIVGFTFMLLPGLSFQILDKTHRALKISRDVNVKVTEVARANTPLEKDLVNSITRNKGDYQPPPDLQFNSEQLQLMKIKQSNFLGTFKVHNLPTSVSTQQNEELLSSIPIVKANVKVSESKVALVKIKQPRVLITTISDLNLEIIQDSVHSEDQANLISNKAEASTLSPHLLPESSHLQPDSPHLQPDSPHLQPDSEQKPEFAANYNSNYSDYSGHQWPLEVTGRVTSNFGVRYLGGNNFHHGIDIAAITGTSILASKEGIVTYADWRGGYGRVVFLSHADGTETRYAHMSNILVTKGQQISQGAQLGEVGSTGFATGPHLHFELHIDGKSVNPINYLVTTSNETKDNLANDKDNSALKL